MQRLESFSGKRNPVRFIGNGFSVVARKGQPAGLGGCFKDDCEPFAWVSVCLHVIQYFSLRRYLMWFVEPEAAAVDVGIPLSSTLSTEVLGHNGV